MSVKVRVFRWDADTVRWTVMGVAIFLSDVVAGFAAPWWVTMYVVLLSVSVLIADRAHYWRSRQVEAMRAAER